MNPANESSSSDNKIRPHGCPIVYNEYDCRQSKICHQFIIGTTTSERAKCNFTQIESSRRYSGIHMNYTSVAGVQCVSAPMENVLILWMSIASPQTIILLRCERSLTRRN